MNQINGRQMLRAYHVFIVLLVSLPPLSSAQEAAKARPDNTDLPKRIAAATEERQCKADENCANPEIIADEDGVRVLVRHGTPTDVRMKTSYLATYLQSLPMSAWPKGATIFVMQADVFRYTPRAITTNGEEARRVCTELGLSVKLGQGVWNKNGTLPNLPFRNGRP